MNKIVIHRDVRWLNRFHLVWLDFCWCWPREEDVDG